MKTIIKLLLLQASIWSDLKCSGEEVGHPAPSGTGKDMNILELIGAAGTQTRETNPNLQTRLDKLLFSNTQYQYIFKSSR